MDFPGHFEQIFQQLNYQRVHGQLWDCVIVVGSRHFKAHRSVLAACSTHFRALFTVAEGDASMNMIQLDSEVGVLKGWVTEATCFVCLKYLVERNGKIPNWFEQAYEVR